MRYRHEIKHEINAADMRLLRPRLETLMKKDIHSADGRYMIRSLYFDNIYDKALMEKINGSNYREKFRLRYYNGNTSFIRLEKKTKLNGLTGKEYAFITSEQVELLLRGELFWLMDSDVSLFKELYLKMINQGLRPKTIVDYTREAYTYDAGNVRVTLDYDIHTGMYSTDFLNPQTFTLPIRNNAIILEVKWDNFLPDVIRNTIQLGNRRAGAFSKYASCRVYG